MKTLLDHKTSAEISVEIPILKDLPDDGFSLNVGALTLSLGGRNFILDSTKTSFNNEQEKGGKLTFTTELTIDLETFEPSADSNYELTEADLKNKELKAEFFCSDSEVGIDDGFDFDNAKIECVVYVDGKEYKIKTKLD